MRTNKKYQTPVYLSMFVNVSSANGMNFVVTATEFNIGEEIDYRFIFILKHNFVVW